MRRFWSDNRSKERRRTCSRARSGRRGKVRWTYTRTGVLPSRRFGGGENASNGVLLCVQRVCHIWQSLRAIYSQKMLSSLARRWPDKQGTLHRKGQPASPNLQKKFCAAWIRAVPPRKSLEKKQLANHLEIVFLFFEFDKKFLSPSLPNIASFV